MSSINGAGVCYVYTFVFYQLLCYLCACPRLSILLSATPLTPAARFGDHASALTKSMYSRVLHAYHSHEAVWEDCAIGRPRPDLFVVVLLT